MAILSNVAIIEALNDGRVDIKPRPAIEPGQADTPYNTVSVDLQLSSCIYTPKESAKSLTFRLSQDINVTSTLDLVYDECTIPGTGFNLEPNKFILGSTVEHVSLPLMDNGLSARIEGRSSAARLGLIVHFTAPTIHAGFSGRITLEMINLGPAIITLHPNTYVCQLILETIEGNPKEKESQFQGQKTALG